MGRIRRVRREGDHPPQPDSPFSPPSPQMKLTVLFFAVLRLFISFDGVSRCPWKFGAAHLFVPLVNIVCWIKPYAAVWLLLGLSEQTKWERRAYLVEHLLCVEVVHWSPRTEAVRYHPPRMKNSSDGILKTANIAWKLHDSSVEYGRRT